MEKQIVFAWAMLISCLAIAPVYGQHRFVDTVEAAPRAEKMTRLHFFFHDILSGKNPSSVLIARPNTTERSVFNNLFAIDDPLTMGPEPNSTVIGNAQGIYLVTTRDPASYSAVLYVDFEFTTSELNGSSFSLFSRYPSTEFVLATKTVREMAIVGGKGVFRMARGFALIRATYADAMTGDSILEFNVTLYHY